MATHQPSEAFLLIYRADGIHTLPRYIQAGNNCSVVELYGCGRSRPPGVLRLLPDVLRSFLPPRARPTALTSVDLCDLPTSDFSIVYPVQSYLCVF
jgi:hypothetical protein